MATPKSRLPGGTGGLGGVRDVDTSQILRMLHNMFKIGKITKNDAKKATYDVDFGDNKPVKLRQLVQRAGGDQTFDMHDKDEQVLVLCPGGDLAQGIVIGAMYKDDPGRPFDDEDHSGRRTKDGTIVKHDRKNKTTTTTLPKGGKHVVQSSTGHTMTLSDDGFHFKGPATVDGDTKLLGNTDITKNLKVDGDSKLNGGSNFLGGATSIPGLMK